MSVTIQEAIDAIVARIPGAPRADSVDTVKVGNPALPLTGIATAFTVTFDVMEKAKESGANLIVTHEPTFYDHYDRMEDWGGDPVREAKLRRLEELGLTVWRFHDYWHAHRPDGIRTGVARKLGWESYLDPSREGMAVVPPTTLRSLAQELKSKLSLPYVRIAGNPDMTCREVAMLLGAPGGERQVQALRRDDVDVVVCGETAEWQTCEYARDASAAGRPRGLVVLGHFASEDDGMRYLVEWLQPLLPGVRIVHLASGDPLSLVL
ncbi:Nif3-like dinuclear metal center hexameric protein [Cohnella zeiphila]|uniref:GTP cyclohydrolase 1 type 2 homolog n=1 Tax=Cohnella zeiphila TaxID=2761120 RepID=A0A7X0SNK4_9BACL|nr:Nif3-like dinuclear metal center hexameric protein [Cohnella zeiphila]MBB6733201.1 Nif3-like dinuclear metal center hexameric protein [Cohnella zeiphila]